jgi:subtilisin family serine protease
MSHRLMRRAGFEIGLCLFLAAAIRIGAVSAAGRPEPTRAYWVFFQDRGMMDTGPAALARAAQSIPAQAWARRARGRSGALPDEKDLPLWEPYAQAVAQIGVLRHRSRWLNAVSAELSPRGLDQTRALPWVREVRPVAVGRDQSIGPMVTPDGVILEQTLPLRAEPARGPYPYGPAYGQLVEIGVPAVHALGYTGSRVRFMMLDTGFRKDHHAFSSTHILAEWDFVFEDGNTQNEAQDDPGQQTHGTGTWAVAGGYDPGHIVGPAYRADFVLAKTEDVRSETQAEEDNYVAALEWADQLGVSVTSASLSYTCFDDGFCYDYPLKDGDFPVISRAVDIAAARGIICVNSAGNYGYQGPMSLGTPADADSVLSVGAVDSLNVLADFSSRGPSDDGRTKPEVVARGVATWWADANDVSHYGPASGTSLSCPLVGGCAALLLEAHPEWGGMDVRAALMGTADRHNHPDDDYGWGRISLPAALNWSPVVFPVPFSLLSPLPDAYLTNLTPLLRWHASRDPDLAGPVRYSVHLFDTATGGSEWSLPSGTDTTLTISFPLRPERIYGWEVAAEDMHGHRRFSREIYRFHTPVGAAARDDQPSAGAHINLSFGPNPSRTNITFRVSPSTSSALGQPLSWAIYDPIGRRVTSGATRPAATSATWDGRDSKGAPVPAGVYFLEVRRGNDLARGTLVRLAP